MDDSRSDHSVGHGRATGDDAGLAALKKQTRSQMKARRESLSRERHAQLSKDACEQLLDHVSFGTGEVVGLFLPIQSEIDASLLIEPLLYRGVRLALPIPIGRTGMIFRLWHPGEPLVDAGFGTRAPDADALEIAAQTLIMPLLAFDAHCNRLGHGAGHYDRYISERILEGHRPRLIGLAFALQQLDKVPVGGYDLPLDMVVTEDGIAAVSGQGTFNQTG